MPRAAWESSAEWQHAQAEDSWDQGFGIVHRLWTFKALFRGLSFGYGAVSYPKTSFNLSSSKLLSSVDNKELREEKDILYSSDVWAIITEAEACVLFLCVYW